MPYAKDYYLRRDNWVREITESDAFTDAEARVATVIAMRCVDRERETFAYSHRKIAKLAKQSAKTVQRAIKKLQELGYIQRVRSAPENRAWTYLLLTRPVDALHPKSGGWTPQSGQTGHGSPPIQQNSKYKQTCIGPWKKAGGRPSGLFDRIAAQNGISLSPNLGRIVAQRRTSL